MQLGMDGLGRMGGDEGKVKADIELQPLSSINQVLDRLEHGDVASRVVLEFAPG